MTLLGILLIFAGLIGGCTLGLSDSLAGGSGLIGWVVAGGGTVLGVIALIAGSRRKK